MRPSPDERPRSRLPTQGPAKEAAHRSSPAAPRQPVGRDTGGPGSGRVQESSLPGTASACASAAAIRSWPSGAACSRSGLHSRGSVTTGWWAVSATATPSPAGRPQDALVQRGDPRAQRAGERAHPGDVGKRDGRDADPLGRERREHRLQVTGDLIGVEPGAQQVVDPGDHRRQVGAQGEGRCQLLLVDVPGEAAPYGQIGVPQARVVRGEALGEPVGEPAQADRVVAVTDAFGLAVSQRHVPQEPLFSAAHGLPSARAGR